MPIDRGYRERAEQAMRPPAGGSSPSMSPGSSPAPKATPKAKTADAPMAQPPASSGLPRAPKSQGELPQGFGQRSSDLMKQESMNPQRPATRSQSQVNSDILGMQAGIQSDMNAKSDSEMAAINQRMNTPSRRDLYGSNVNLNQMQNSDMMAGFDAVGRVRDAKDQAYDQKMATYNAGQQAQMEQFGLQNSAAVDEQRQRMGQPGYPMIGGQPIDPLKLAYGQAQSQGAQERARETFTAKQNADVARQLQAVGLDWRATGAASPMDALQASGITPSNAVGGTALNDARAQQQLTDAMEANRLGRYQMANENRQMQNMLAGGAVPMGELGDRAMASVAMGQDPNMAMRGMAGLMQQRSMPEIEAQRLQSAAALHQAGLLSDRELQQMQVDAQRNQFNQEMDMRQQEFGLRQEDSAFQRQLAQQQLDSQRRQNDPLQQHMQNIQEAGAAQFAQDIASGIPQAQAIAKYQQFLQAGMQIAPGAMQVPGSVPSGIPVSTAAPPASSGLPSSPAVTPAAPTLPQQAFIPPPAPTDPSGGQDYVNDLVVAAVRAGIPLTDPRVQTEAAAAGVALTPEMLGSARNYYNDYAADAQFMPWPLSMGWDKNKAAEAARARDALDQLMPRQQ